MDEIKVQDERVINLVRRIARLWSAMIVALGVIIFVAEIIEASTTELNPYPWYENLIPFTLFTAIAGLALAWRWEGLGGAMAVISVAVNLGTYILTEREAVGIVLLILTPVLIPGILMLYCWYRSRGVSNRQLLEGKL
jgi:hypothetical protein